MRAPAHGIYVHMPWCASRCPYCAFNVHTAPSPPFTDWATAVLREAVLREPAWAAHRAAEGGARSLYIGGGTPSLAPPEVLARVVAGLPRAPDAVVSMELNPGTIDAETVAGLVDAGANRLSVGVQTFQPRHARLLNRGHTVHQAEALVEIVAAAPLRSWNLDLIFALPGQTMAELDADLDALLGLDPPHVSLYGLTFEPGTPLARMRDEGIVAEPEGELWRAMYERIVERLQLRGLERYEVSNFAHPGHRSTHNDDIWRGGFYLGLGPGAHGFQPDGGRTVGRADPATWMADPLGETTTPDADGAAADFVLSTLRHVEGLDLHELAENFDRRADAATLDRLAAAGLAHQRGEHLVLSAEGMALADGISARVIWSLEER